MTSPSLVLVLMLADASSVVWPAILPGKVSVMFDPARRSSLDVDVLGGSGKAIYRLSCRTYLTAENSHVHEFAGDFDCHLFEVSNEGGSSWIPNLLVEDIREKPWMARSRFLRPELVGACAIVPQFGLKREFRLRGMRLSISLSEIEVDSEDVPLKEPMESAIKKMKVTIRFNPDPLARTEVAAKVRGASPPPECR